MKPSKQIEQYTLKRRTIFAVASIVVAFLTTGYLLFNEDYEDTPITNMTVGDDTAIQFGKNKAIITDPDTAKSTVVFKGWGH
jgi:hypothetical protein